MIGYAKAIKFLSERLKELKDKEKEHSMYIETAYPLSTQQINKIKKNVKRKITRVETTVNPQVLGGFKLIVGDDLWDKTILLRINQVKEVISGRFNSSN